MKENQTFALRSSNQASSVNKAPKLMNEDQKTNEFVASLKSEDTEEKIDIYFYRPIGLQIAKFCAKVNISPNAVTIISIFIGIAAGFFFYYDSISINVIGMLLLIFADALDSADGQLARLTNNKSRYGRILDGLAGDFWFASISIALVLRLINDGWSPFIWILAFASGFSHMIQSAMSDYYRNVYLYFLKGVSGSELDNSSNLDAQIEQLKKEHKSFELFVMNGYRNYTHLQERMSATLQKLLHRNKVDDSVYEKIRPTFLVTNKPLMPLTNIIQFNTRVIFLFIWLFIGHVWLYFVFDIVVLNSVLWYLRNKQEKTSAQMLNMLDK